MKTLVYAILAFFIVTVVAWGGLFVWAAIFLTPGDSYWDRTPYAADAFFSCWLVAAAGAAIAAGLWRRNKCK